MSDPNIRRVVRDPALRAWTALQTLARPFVQARAALRRYRRRDGKRTAPDAVDLASIDLAATASIHAHAGPHVVLAGSGLGEFAMMRRIAEALLQARPDAKVSYTLRDPGALAFVRGHYPGWNVSLWEGADTLRVVIPWLESQKPDVLALFERYRFPVFVNAAVAYGARVALLNGRFRLHRSLRDRVLAPIYRWQFGGFSAMAMQREDYFQAARRFARPGCDLRLVGDLKADVQAPVLPQAQARSLAAWLRSDLPLVAAGSTDTLEEERMVLAAFVRARALSPCRLLLAPRQVSELGALRTALGEAGLTVSCRSGGGAGGGADVFLLDTQGELATAYRPCVAAYVGGAYSARGGGHNVMEPLVWGLPVAYGLKRGFFEALQVRVEGAGLGTRISNERDLAAFWVRFLSDAGECERVRAVSDRLVAENRGAVEETVETLVALLDS